MDKRAVINKGNSFVIQIVIKGKKINGSKKVLCLKSSSQLAKRIEEEFVNQKEGEEITLRVVDKKNHEVKTLKIKRIVEGRETIKEIKDKIDTFNSIQHTPNNEKYRVIIDNIQTKKYDKKSLSFCFPGKIEECKEEIQQLFNNLIKEIEDEDIVFGDKQDLITHRILIHKSGETNAYKNYKSLSFSISLPNYSSAEIIEITRGKL